jgi:hypothetical protein
LNRFGELFAQPNLERAQAAILINEWNYQLCTLMAQGGGHLPYSVRGWHRLLWEASIPVDFLEASELDEPYASQYKVIILPFPLSMSEEIAAKLARCVERGGCLISEACPGRINEHAYCNRGELSPTLRELFGVRPESFTMVREPDGGARWSPAERTWGEYLDAAMLEGTGALTGHALRANVYIETFTCRGSEPCLLYGDRGAGVLRKLGRGEAWLLGTFAGHCGTAYRDSASQACLRALLAHCGIQPNHTGELVLRKRIGTRRQAWIFTNPLDRPITERINVAGWPNVQDLLGDPLDRQDNLVTLTVPSLDVRVLIVQL